MSKINITVEMTDDEYEEYKKFISRTHPSQNISLDKVSYDKYFVAHGMELTDSNEEFDTATRENIYSMTYKSKDKKTVATIAIRKNLTLNPLGL